MKSLTVFEETVLIAIYRLQEDAYSVSIHQKIFEMTGKDIVIGSLYNALDQLLKKGYLGKQKGEPAAEKGGKSKMYYYILKDGFLAMEQTRKLHTILWDDLPDVLYKEQ